MRITGQAGPLLQPVQPAAECPYGSVIGVAAIIAGEIGQKGIYIPGGEIIAVYQRLEAIPVELYGPLGSALPPGADKFSEKPVTR